MTIGQMFAGTNAPFLAPLAADATQSSGGYVSYVPLCYSRSVKITTSMTLYFISLPAGIAGMAPARFGLYTTIGCIPWTAALAAAEYAVGANWQSIANGFHAPTYLSPP